MLELEFATKLLWLAMGIPAAELLLTFTKSRKKLATSRLGTKKDMGKLTGINGLILSKKFQLTFNKTLEGTVIIAPTGEGKTASLFLPNLLSNHFPKSSLVISDPKGELFEKTSQYQNSIGREPILFEPLGNNAKYNPREFCIDFTEVRNLASNLIQSGDLAIQLASGKSGGSSEWLNMSTPLYVAALLNSKSISESVKFLINTNPMELIQLFGNNENEDIKEQFRIFMSSAGSPKTMSSILSTLLTSLQLFTDHNLINTTSSSSFAPTSLRERPIALYIKYDVSKSNYLSPFLSVFFSQLIEKIMYTKGLPVLFFLDEAQNIGRISNLEQVVATCRSEEVGFIVCLQNIVKLYDVYGKNNTITILNNLKTKACLPSLSDYEALTYLSNLCGNTEYKTETTTGDKSTRGTSSKKLFAPDEIRRIETNNILIIPHNKLPLLHEQNYYKQEKYYKNVPIELRN